MSRAAFVLGLCAAAACGGVEDVELSESEARVLAETLLIVDTHVDLPYRLHKRMDDVAQKTERGDFDYLRARQGGLDVAFLSIYVPSRYQEDGGARQYADELIDMVEGLVAAHPDRFTLVRTPVEVTERRRDPHIGFALGIENGAAIEDRLELLEHFYSRGVRYLTLTHSKANLIADSSYDTARRWGGLSPFGREVVAAMNRLGMIVDVSHVSDEAFADVLEVSRAPVIASHSSCRHFTPGWERNMSDEMIRALAAARGVIQINFGSMFLDDAYRKRREVLRDQMKAELARQGIDPDSDQADLFGDEFFAAHPLEPVGVERVADHIDHVVQLVGVDHVGLGSDFEGVGNSLPRGLEDVSGYPNLLRVLAERGYTTGDLAKICSGNLLRVWNEVERTAAELQAGGARPQ